MFNGIKEWCSEKLNDFKRGWNNRSSRFRSTLLNAVTLTFGSGKFFKDIGLKLFFLTSLFTPLLGTSAVGRGFNIAIALLVVAGVSYTNYLTSFSALRYKIFKNFHALSLDDHDEYTPILSAANHHIQADSMLTSESNQICTDWIKEHAILLITNSIVLTRLVFVFCDTYLGTNKLFSKTASLFNKTFNPTLLSKLTTGVGSYLAISEAILFISYVYKIFIENCAKIKETLSWDNIRSATIYKAILAFVFASLGILSKGLKDCFEISKSLHFTPFIKKLPDSVLSKIGYFGGVNSIMAKSVFEGFELAKHLYNPKPFIDNTKQAINESKSTYVDILAFMLDSVPEAAGGYLSVDWLFEKTGLKDKLEQEQCLNPVLIPCGILVASSVAATNFAFKARSLRDNRLYDEELREITAHQPLCAR